MVNELNNRLQRLEEKFEFQENTIDSLNDVLIEQQNQMIRLEGQLARLEGLLFNIQSDSSPTGGQEPPPPHY